MLTLIPPFFQNQGLKLAAATTRWCDAVVRVLMMVRGNVWCGLSGIRFDMSS